MAGELKAGTLLSGGRYKVRKEINRGGTAIVYEADDTQTKERVALKVMNTRDGVMTMPVKAVKREIEYASSMEHDNIVKLIDVFAENQNLVIVWELVNGSDLLDLLNEYGGRMSERRAFRYFAQLLHGVIFLHHNGFCHRDLKPENCMVHKKTDELKIIDFGLSKHLDSAVTLGVGTPDYMAPELLNNKAAGGGGRGMFGGGGGSYDARAVDVWAMGVILYLMVTGTYPFENPMHPENVSFTLKNVRDGAFRPLPSDVSGTCADLIAQMLTKKPGKRITLSALPKHAWMKAQMESLVQRNQTLPGGLNLNNIAEARGKGNSARKSGGRKLSTDLNKISPLPQTSGGEREKKEIAKQTSRFGKLMSFKR